MSYQFTCYFQDETIATTTMYVSYIGQTYIGSYGDDYKSVSGLGDNWSTRFTANPAEGCEFVRWVYRIGSTSAAVQYSYNNPFTYSGGADIYIRAEGTYSGGEEPDPEPTWNLSYSTIGQISADYAKSISVGSYMLYRYKVSFQNSGEVTIYTEGSVDTYGYLGTSTGWYSDDGTPTNYITYNDDGGSDTNFQITYNVTAGTTYYIWVKSYDGTDTGTTTLYIVPPAATTVVEKWSWTKSNNNATASQTQKAYTAITNKGYVTDFSYIVWNDLVDKVKEILDATGGSWDASYTTFAAAKMTSSDKTLTAAKFNSLRYNIGSHYSTGIAEKIPGDYVYGWYITTLAECINGWIDSL